MCCTNDNLDRCGDGICGCINCNIGKLSGKQIIDLSQSLWMMMRPVAVYDKENYTESDKRLM